MKELSLQELKIIELGILKHLDNFCKNNGLNYYLAGGTLLGAIRHKGFIPWDDDIDVLMPRKDYMKLIDLIAKDDSSVFNILSIYNSKDYYYSFAKMIDSKTQLIEENLPKIKKLGVNIDIFPLDGFPNYGIFLLVMALLKILKMLSISSCFIKPNDKRKVIPKFILYKISKFIGANRILKTIDKFAKTFSYENNVFVGCSVAGYGAKEKIHKNVFLNSIEVVFEGELFRAPKGYHEYLSSLYGDYMLLPPIEKQVTHHDFKAYLK